ncbi:hypothetical protein V2J09_008495 [Rumex salicifolius]
MNYESPLKWSNNTHSRSFPNPIPYLAIFVLIALFLLGFGVSLFILVEVHNAVFLVSLLLLFSLVFTFLLWNSLSRRRRAALHLFLRSFPESDLRTAHLGQLVKITGPVSCGDISLESSYEKVGPCIFTSTLLYECKKFGSRLPNASELWPLWSLAYSERFCTDFYICDQKSGIRALVKAGFGCNITPLVKESRLVNTRRKNGFTLSQSLKKWLDDRCLSNNACLIRLEEGYITEGSLVTVAGIFHRENNIIMIVQPPELLSTGCIWPRLLLPMDFDGVILDIHENSSPSHGTEDTEQRPPDWFLGSLIALYFLKPKTIQAPDQLLSEAIPLHPPSSQG